MYYPAERQRWRNEKAVRRISAHGGQERHGRSESGRRLEAKAKNAGFSTWRSNQKYEKRKKQKECLYQQESLKTKRLLEIDTVRCTSDAKAPSKVEITHRNYTLGSENCSYEILLHRLSIRTTAFAKWFRISTLRTMTGPSEKLFLLLERKEP